MDELGKSFINFPINEYIKTIHLLVFD